MVADLPAILLAVQTGLQAIGRFLGGGILLHLHRHRHAHRHEERHLHFHRFGSRGEDAPVDDDGKA